MSLRDDLRQRLVDCNYLGRLSVVICDLESISYVIYTVRKSDLRVWRSWLGRVLLKVCYKRQPKAE
jgi:hypothetical protein